MKLHIVSLGCTKNLIDTEVMLGRLKEMEITDSPEEADVLIVNTCGFIEAAKRESLETIFSLHQRRKRDSLLVVAGCLSQRYREELQKELPEVDLFTGVGDYDRIDRLLAEKRSRFSPRVYLIDDEERVVTGSTYHAYIKLSEGCNQRCSFCAIPSFKGRLQSRPLDSVVREIERLVAKGYKDFTFVSQDSSSYLYDFGIREGLIKLIEAVEKIGGVESARILYLYPSTTTEELIDRIAHSPLFVNYFDMPIQHISDPMLKIMGRGIGAQRTLELLEKMRDLPESFLRTAVIVGHPGEDEAQFQKLKEFIEEFPFDRVSIFAYSEEEGTRAFSMEKKVPQEIIEARSQELGEIVERKLARNLRSLVGREIVCYLDGMSEESPLLLSGRDYRWAPKVDGEVLINDSHIESLIPSQRYRVEITDVAGTDLIGHITSRP
ncbi:MAG: 30S ribosomal protein S12 methylthiotransferase RimO [Epsilonproteobacteria bacterium]|nr:30S ribosomal protein S12 methylthiotransferase RimO [Campylobacterota bacterium]NPA56830.1 30S ribosomal protein S12 methylthiotransferase RimO [Campylobacterota bacterium]